MRILISAILIIILCTAFLSCKQQDLNYIVYYQKVNEIDSVYKLANKPKEAAKQYKKLFRKYEPKNQDLMQEYGNYITLADQHNIKFKRKKSLKKLIHLLAPGQHHDWQRPYYPLFNKYGIDSLKVKWEMAIWESNLNKVLLDSFSVAMERDQAPRIAKDYDLVELNNEKNFELLKWTFENFGYPSREIIGLKGNRGRDIHVSTIILNQFATKDYEYLKNELIKYVKSGDLEPTSYASFIDRYEVLKERGVIYGERLSFEDVLDTIQIDKNRKNIGLPSMKHTRILINMKHNDLKK